MKTNEERIANGKRPFPSPAPDCPPKPDLENVSHEEAWKMIDQNGSNTIDAKEGFEAFFCLVEWGALKEDEAWAIYDFLGEHVGDDGELDQNEMGAAINAMEAMSEEEIAERVHGASNL